jgi:hypothetical protein
MTGTPQTKRWFARVGARSNQEIVHFWTDRAGNSRAMGWPNVIVLLEHPDGPMLYRYIASGKFAGDTWHQSVEEARLAASLEYTTSLGPWLAIPQSVPAGRESDYALGTAPKINHDAEGG